ncbi:hypothetical protein F8M41_000895 [Gigaspora margarita]|uniref:Uncharacterized protein n=1 Tax=Gigaspora margarita TaxID=4874 RepID=A0A8H3XI96_GIGMA|nr:hypothetical protein F8M41_000895 [Gigaspora margarita]
MFQGMKFTTKKSSKKDSSKKSNRGKAFLEETRGSELTQSFSESLKILELVVLILMKIQILLNVFKARTLAKIIENQGEILHQLQELNSKVGRLENQFKEMEEKMNNNFDFTNAKTFKEDNIKGAARILIKKSIYLTKDQIKSEVENYVWLLEKFRALWGYLKYNTGFLLSSSEDETEKEKSKKEPVRKHKNKSKKISKAKSETSEEEQKDQEESPEDLKKAKQEPEDNDSNNVKKL